MVPYKQVERELNKNHYILKLKKEVKNHEKTYKLSTSY